MLKPGDLIHFYNPKADAGSIFNWWAERYAIVGHNAVLIVAEKKAESLAGFSLCYPREYWDNKRFTRLHRVTKRIDQSFLGFKYSAWIQEEFNPEPLPFVDSDASYKALDETDKWFNSVFRYRFR